MMRKLTAVGGEKDSPPKRSGNGRPVVTEIEPIRGAMKRQEEMDRAIGLPMEAMYAAAPMRKTDIFLPRLLGVFLWGARRLAQRTWPATFGNGSKIGLTRNSTGARRRRILSTVRLEIAG